MVALLKVALRIFTWSRNNFMWHVGMVVFHSDMYSHVQWLQPSSELLYDVFNFSCDHLIKDHVIGRLGTISSFLQNLFHIQYPFLKLWHDSIENWYYKSRKVITKLHKRLLLRISYIVRKSLLQSASGIRKNVRYFKVWQAVIAKCVRYYKLWQLLQSET